MRKKGKDGVRRKKVGDRTNGVGGKGGEEKEER